MAVGDQRPDLTARVLSLLAEAQFAAFDFAGGWRDALKLASTRSGLATHR